ncbi:MAG: CCA tRNA nucleotidyltransferase [Planctomycetota bacterium]|nr:CCA tRNA nucleotidyltransferase [Planctomycetota bacterium]
MSDKYRIALSVIRTLQKNGFQAYLAGGCVRDRLLSQSLKRIPKDYDVATDARPAQVIRQFNKTLAIGKAFGVVAVFIKGHQIEVTTFRTEGRYSDGRHPDRVKYAQRDDDIFRRDFTINGLFYDPIRHKLIDLVHGRADLKKKVIRTIGKPKERFSEDKLRMMRAIRFAVELGFSIEPETKNAISPLSTQITKISKERIREELKRILISPRRDVGVKLLDETGLLNQVLPEVVRMKGVKQPIQFHPEGDVYIHTLTVLKHLKNPSFELALATLLHDIGKPDTFMITDRIRFHEHERIGSELAKRLCRRLKLSNAETETICWIISRHLVFKDIDKMRVSTLKRLFSHPAYPLLAELHRVDRLGSDMDLKPYHIAGRLYRKLSKEDLKPPPLINGYDLIALGFKPGPIFSKILKRIEESQLEKEITTKAEALELVRKLFKPPD